MRAIARDAASRDNRFSALVLGIVKSPRVSDEYEADSRARRWARRVDRLGAVRGEASSMSFITKSHIPRRMFLPAPE